MIEYALGTLSAAIIVVVSTGRMWFKYAIENRERALRNRQPICGCGHHVSFHDDKGCHHVKTDYYDRETSTCGCVKYVGPEAREEVGS